MGQRHLTFISLHEIHFYYLKYYKFVTTITKMKNVADGNMLTAWN